MNIINCSSRKINTKNTNTKNKRIEIEKQFFFENRKTQVNEIVSKK